ncbi:MAG TPA: 3-hydroxybutyryl-CoA dehydrogenase [Acidobacteriota bacterium]|nr:3-hydroxybutyryl-CoA dehydrogenase [Acidobacteriota bacterium]
MKIAVIGAGTMGSGIAQVAAYNGHQVVLKEIAEDPLKKGLEGIRKSLSKVISKRQDVQDPDSLQEEVVGRIQPTTRWDELAEAEFVVEAVFENYQVKKELLEKLDEICSQEAVLSSNTSSISITRLGANIRRPERFIGMHFMNPVPLMKLVEIIRGLATSDETYQRTKDLTEQLEKIPVEVNDSPGFVSNRVLMPMINEAIFARQEGVAEVENIDAVMKLGMNHPMGPLKLADLIGLDVCLDVLNVLYEGFKDPRYRPCPLLQRMVDAGWLGRKSGKGFYEY